MAVFPIHNTVIILMRNNDYSLLITSTGFPSFREAHGRVIGWGIVLQAEWPRVRFPSSSHSVGLSPRSLFLFIAWIFNWHNSSKLSKVLEQKWVPGIVLGIKGGRCVRHPHLRLWADCSENVELLRLTVLWVSTACYGDSFTLWRRSVLPVRYKLDCKYCYK
jgi:hypothetical protein